MNITNAVVLVAGLAVTLPPRLDAQSRAFDSVTINRNTSGETRGGLRLMPDGGVTAINVTLRQLIQSVYQRHAFDRRQIEGGPAWIDTDRFDVIARATGGHVFGADSFPRQTWVMLQSLLEDRFQLKVRTDPREVPVYELRLSKTKDALGPRLRRVDVDCGALMKMKTKDEPPTGMQAGRPVCAVAPYQGRLIADALTIPALAGVLSGMLDRPVLDRTALAGSFAIELEAVEIKAPGPLGPSARPSDTKESIFSAMPEQLGLTLEPTAGAVDVIVVESAQHPTTDKVVQ